MVGYPYSYGDNLTQEEASKRLKEVRRGAMFVISFYLLSTQVANAAEGTPPPPVPGPGPGASGISPAPANNAHNTLSKELYAGFVSIVCSTAVNTGDFWIGIVCGLVVVAGMRLARTAITKD